ncbi:DUF7919 family protein [Streptomyces sp. NBC_01485]|uniref:DUF7919 family protein n=1 Tax=Streptomyces sp. NBC_01485 TaxID=2903884 RepID=UPI003FCE250B
MAHFEDLSRYSYSESSEPMFNVGWLSRGYEFNVGEVPEGLVDSLLELARNPSNVHRGMHFCELCPSFVEARKNVRFDDVFVGSGEMRVRGEGGAVYVAPIMIVHYVADHGYRPPTEFVESVLRVS